MANQSIIRSIGPLSRKCDFRNIFKFRFNSTLSQVNVMPSQLESPNVNADILPDPGFKVKDLFEAGVHWGHKIGSLDPRMAPYLFGERLGHCVFDLDVTASHLRTALQFTCGVAAAGGIILFGSGRDPRNANLVEKAAVEAGEYAHVRTWRGGVFTNSTFQFGCTVTACCCLFLAGKVEETPKKCKDIIKTARSLLTDQKFLQFGDDPKEEVMTLERILLQTIKFDLQVEHPYSYLLKYAKCLKGDKNRLQKMVQMAWTFVNDSLCTTLCLQWEPEVIAVALIYLAGKLSKFEATDWVGRTPRHLRWWDMVLEGVTMDLLEDICHQVLDLYSQPQTDPTADSPPPPPAPHPSIGAGIQGVSVVGVTPSILTVTSSSTSSSNTPGPLPTTPKASTAIPLIRESAQPIKALSPAPSGIPVKMTKGKDSKKHVSKIQSDLITSETVVEKIQIEGKGMISLTSVSEAITSQAVPQNHFAVPPSQFHHASSPTPSSFSVPPPINFSAPPPNISTVVQGTGAVGSSGSNGHHSTSGPTHGSFSQFAPPFAMNQPPPSFYSTTVPPPRSYYPPPGSS